MQSARTQHRPVSSLRAPARHFARHPPPSRARAAPWRCARPIQPVTVARRPSMDARTETASARPPAGRAARAPGHARRLRGRITAPPASLTQPPRPRERVGRLGARGLERVSADPARLRANGRDWLVGMHPGTPPPARVRAIRAGMYYQSGGFEKPLVLEKPL